MGLRRGCAAASTSRRLLLDDSTGCGGLADLAAVAEALGFGFLSMLASRIRSDDGPCALSRRIGHCGSASSLAPRPSPPGGTPPASNCSPSSASRRGLGWVSSSASTSATISPSAAREIARKRPPGVMSNSPYVPLVTTSPRPRRTDRRPGRSELGRIYAQHARSMTSCHYLARGAAPRLVRRLPLDTYLTHAVPAVRSSPLESASASRSRSGCADQPSAPGRCPR